MATPDFTFEGLEFFDALTADDMLHRIDAAVDIGASTFLGTRSENEENMVMGEPISRQLSSACKHRRPLGELAADRSLRARSPKRTAIFPIANALTK